MLYCTVLYCTVLCCAVLYCTVLCCTVLCCTVLYCTVLYCAVLYCTVLTLFVIFTHSDVEDSYSGPKLDDDISAGFMKNMLQWFKDQKKLYKKYCYKVSTL